MKFLYLLLLPTLCFGQQYETGERPLNPIEIKEGSTLSFTVKEKLAPVKDLADLMPLPGDQGGKKSCWAWAAAYVLRSAIDKNKSLQNGTTTDYSKVYSPEFVYQFYRDPGESGCSVTANAAGTLKKILKSGAVKYNDLKYDALKCDIPITNNLIKKAKQNAKPEFDAIITTDLYTIKKALSEGMPVILSMQIDAEFKKLNAKNAIWKTKGQIAEHHAMVAIGYDDNRNALHVLNSWGSGFGIKGYLWIDYALISIDQALNYACYAKKTLAVLPTKEGSLQDEPDNIVSDSAEFLSSWIKKGYFRYYGKYKIVVSELIPKKNFAVIEIRDDHDNLLTNFYIDAKTNREFYLDGNRYKFELNNIAKAGKIFLKQAAYFTITKI